MAVEIRGTGSYIPEKIVENRELEQMVETTDVWIRERTGICRRHIAEKETVVDMGTQAAVQALQHSGISAQEIDLLIVSTLSAETVMPSVSCRIQERIGAVRAVCFDLNAACSGFLLAYQSAEAYLESGAYKTALIIGSERLSNIIDWKDRNSCILFGDGAGAVFVRADNTKRYVAVTGSDGQKGDVLQAGRIPLKNLLVKNVFTDTDYYMSMNGQEVFKFAVKTVPEAIRQVTEKAGVALDEIDCFLLHQANVRIIASVAKRLGIPEDKVPVNLNHYGNTSAASIAILLDEVRRERRFSPGSRLVLAGFGGGLTWGASIAEWI